MQHRKTWHCPGTYSDSFIYVATATGTLYQSSPISGLIELEARSVSEDVVNSRLAELAGLDRSDLGEQWTALFGSSPPRHSKSTLLYQALAWNLQLQAHPHWSKAASMSRRKRSLNAVSTPTLATGSRLVREWQGTTHQVAVVDQGFEYDGRTYRSLSAVAKAITGTHWSGPLFFGVRK